MYPVVEPPNPNSKVQFQVQEEESKKEDKIQPLHTKIAHLRMNALQTAMKVGWETDPK